MRERVAGDNGSSKIVVPWRVVCRSAPVVGKDDEDRGKGWLFPAAALAWVVVVVAVFRFGGLCLEDAWGEESNDTSSNRGTAADTTAMAAASDFWPR